MKPAALSAAVGAFCILIASPVRAQEGDALPPRADDGGSTLILVEVAINGAVRGGQYLAAEVDGDYWLRAEDLDRWRIDRSGAAPRLIEGETMIALSALPGVTVRLDAARQGLELTVPADRFMAQIIETDAARVRPTAGAVAAFLNYDLSIEADDRVTGGAFIEAGISDDWGLIVSSATAGRASGGGGLTRLDSYYLLDFPERLMRLVVGDTVTDARDWSRQVRFGGVRLGTEFALQPSLVTFPVPEFGDRAAVPSSVELLVNDALRYQGQVDQGPFSINQIPVVTGAGDVTLVVRDALGVERRVKTSYYVSSRLLSRGLSAWSIEAGAERRAYGFRSFDYGDAFVAGSYRRGLTDWLTAESRVEVGGDVRMAGAGVDFVWPAVGEFGIAGALSSGRTGKGSLYRVFFSRVTPRWNVAVSYQRATKDFDQLGIDFGRDRITRQLQATAGVSFGRFGNAALSWTDLRYADGNRTQLASANYSVSISNRAYVNLFAFRSRTLGSGWDTTAGIGLTIPFGPQSSAYAQADSRNVMAEWRRTVPNEGGWGYRAAVSVGETDRQQAELNWRGDVGEVSVEAARFDGQVGARLLARGGLLLAGGQMRPTRRVQEGMGVIEVPGQPDVRIYQENRLVTRTDSNGRAIIPDLRAYEGNRISLSPSDLPLDASMPGDVLIIVPRFRGAALGRFDISADRPGTIVVTAPGGAPVETGAKVRTSGGEQSFAGYDGEIFLRRIAPGMTLDIDVDGGTCHTRLPETLPEEALPRIGPLRCAIEGARP